MRVSGARRLRLQLKLEGIESQLVAYKRFLPSVEGVQPVQGRYGLYSVGEPAGLSDAGLPDQNECCPGNAVSARDKAGSDVIRESIGSVDGTDGIVVTAGVPAVHDEIALVCDRSLPTGGRAAAVDRPERLRIAKHTWEKGAHALDDAGTRLLVRDTYRRLAVPVRECKPVVDESFNGDGRFYCC